MSATHLTARERDLHRWEWAQVHAHDTTPVTATVAHAVMCHVWAMLAVPGQPPVVQVVLPDRPEFIPGVTAAVNSTCFMVFNTRNFSTSVVLHELAHLLTDDPLSELERKPYAEREMHGELFLTNFLWCLDRLMGPKFNTFRLRASLPPSWRAANLPYHPVVWGQPKVAA